MAGDLKARFAAWTRQFRAARLAVAMAAALGAASASAFMPTGGALPAAADGGVTDQIIVKFRPGVASKSPQAARWSAMAGEALAHAREFGDDGHVLKLRGRVPLARAQAIAARLAADPDLEYAEADQMMQPMLVPNDSLYANQWGYFAPTAGLVGANLPRAWDLTTGAGTQYIAVIDTGIRPHADLKGRYIGGYDFIGDTVVANDGNGRDSDPSDPGDWCGSAASSWHGTHVAGTIAAVSNNRSGVSGINWVSRVVPIRALGKCGGYTSDIADGIRWAAGLSVTGVPANPYPARVLNLSLGGGGACSTTYQSAINDVVARGAVVVVAAGNSNADAANFSPASCSGVITVAATGKAGNRSWYSNFGSTVEIAAPGGDSSADGATGTILSTLNGGTTTPGGDIYAYYQGTSMAAPHVAGIASLMFSLNPALTPAQVTQILRSTVTPFPLGSSCTTSSCGSGIVNAAAAVQAVVNTLPPGAFSKSTPSNGATSRPISLSLTWAASRGAVSYQYCIDTTNDNTCAGAWTSVGASTSVAVSGLRSKTTYYWQVIAINANGQTLANSGTWWRFATQ